MGSGGPWGSRGRSHSHAQIITPAHSWQSGSVGSVAGHRSVCSHTTQGSEESSSKSKFSHNQEDVPGEDENTETDNGGVETLSDGQVASDEDWQECPQNQDTLTGVSQVFSRHEDTDPESDHGEKI